MFINKIKDKKITEAVKAIKKNIEGSIFQGHVFLSDDIVGNTMLGKGCSAIHVSVTMENGGQSFANWIALMDESFEALKNPTDIVGSPAYKVFLLNEKKFKDIPIICHGVEMPKTDGEHSVEKILGEDAKGKDFTINAMYYDISNDVIIDPTNLGLSDAASSTLRSVGDADKLFKDNASAMIEAIKLSHKLDLGMTMNLWLSLIKNSHRISKIPKKELKEDIADILTSNKPSKAFEKMRYCGLLEAIFADIFDERSINEGVGHSTYDHTMKCLDLSSDKIESRLAALYHDVGKIVTSVATDQAKLSASVARCDMKDFGFGEDIMSKVERAIANHVYFDGSNDAQDITDRRIRRFLKKCGDDLDVTLELMNANLLSNYGKKKKPLFVAELLKRIETILSNQGEAETKPIVDGKEIMEEFHLRKGPHIGVCLKAVAKAMKDNPQMTKEAAFAIVDQTLKNLAV